MLFTQELCYGNMSPPHRICPLEFQNTKTQKPFLDLKNFHEGDLDTSPKITWRNEQKFWISNYQYHRLRSAFRGVLYIDKYCYEEGDYNIRLSILIPIKESCI